MAPSSYGRRRSTFLIWQAGLNSQTFLGKGSHGHASQAGMFDNSKNIVRAGEGEALP